MIYLCEIKIKSLKQKAFCRFIGGNKDHKAGGKGERWAWVLLCVEVKEDREEGSIRPGA